MKFKKKLIMLAVIALALVLGMVPSTYSWYTHNDVAEGKKINYSDELPISIKSAANTVTASTRVADKNGIASDTSASSISVSTGDKVVYYKTSFINSGSNDVMVDLNAKDFGNNADFYIGTIEPTLNEKAYSSRPIRTKATSKTVRVYFKPNKNMSSYWSVDNGSLLRETGTYMPDGSNPSSTAAAGSSQQASGTTNDINLSYTVGDKEVQVMMNKCEKNNSYDVDDDWSDTGKKVYYYDIPSNTTSFFFFNHWYLRSNSNREWNRTLDITDTTQGKLYYMTNNSTDGNYKEYKDKPVDTDLVAVNSYYESASMSMGDNVYADIAIKKESDNEDDAEFVPDYYGKTLSFSVSSENTSIVTVSKDGLVHPLAYTNNSPVNITTRITGKFGDYIDVDTAVTIPATISQVPVLKNIKVPAASNGENGKTDVLWYAKNNSSSTTMQASIFFTL